MQDKRQVRDRKTDAGQENRCGTGQMPGMSDVQQENGCRTGEQMPDRRTDAGQ